eukprot:1030667-Rhodomonas_salina.1
MEEKTRAERPTNPDARALTRARARARARARIKLTCLLQTSSRADQPGWWRAEIREALVVCVARTRAWLRA